MSHDLVDLGASSLDPETNALTAQCKATEVADGEAPDYGAVPLACALGVTARPYQADESGSAQAIVATDVPGIDAVGVAARDARTAQEYGAIDPGDTVLHGTGPEHHSQVRCQKQMVSIITVDADDFNALIIIDGPKRKIQVAGFGHAFEMSKENGIVLAEEGGATLILKDGAVLLKGSSIALGEGATVPVIIGAPGAGQLPSLSVLVPAG